MTRRPPDPSPPRQPARKSIRQPKRSAGRPRRTARQEEILDIALNLTREVGIGGLTVRALAEKAGFTEAALYRHYPSKQALLLALMRRIEERFLPTFQQIASAPERPVRERLVDVIEHHVATVLAIDGLPIFLLAEAAATGDRELQEQIRGTMGHYLALLEGLVAELPEDDLGGRTPRELALVLMGLSAATALHHRLFPDEAVERAAAEALPAHLVERLLTPSTP